MSGRGERGGAEIYSVDIAIPSAEAPDWAALVDKCSAADVVSNGHGGEFKMEPGNIEGLSSWATSYLATDPGGTGWIRAIIGNYRGVVVWSYDQLMSLSSTAGSATGDAAALAELFNDQAKMLENAQS